MPADEAPTAYFVQPDTRASVTIFFGGDEATTSLLAQRGLSAWRVTPGPPCVVEAHTLGASTDANVVEVFASSPSLFAERGALVLQNLKETHRKTLSRQLTVFAASGADEKRIFISAASLRAKSAFLSELRRAPGVLAISCWDPVWRPSDIDAALARRRLSAADPTVQTSLAELSRALSLSSFDDLLDQLALFAGPDGVIDTDAVSFCAPNELLSAGDDFATFALNGDREALLAAFRSRLALGDAPSAIALALGRAFTTLVLATTQANTHVFWKLDRARKDAERRFGDYRLRLERAVLEIHKSERALREHAQKETLEVERLLLRICQIFARKSSSSSMR